MNIAIPIQDTEINKNRIASGLNVNGNICLYDMDSNSYVCMKTSELAENMGELLPALERRDISVIITHQIHPMALKILVNKGFEVYKAIGNTLDENIIFYQNKKLDLYSHKAAMDLATVCGGECTTCATDVCDEEKKI
jgi:predicted Fe-Mo cluster-binding NifX family protein